MLIGKLKQLTFAVAAVLTIMCAPAYATSIKIAVAANFAATLNSMLGPFQSLYPSDSFSLVSDSTTNIKNAIISAGTATTYDLFLSADFAAPQDLYANHNSLVVGAPFHYATGSLELWSKTVNISAGLPNPLTTNIVIADPTKAPYGKAAQQVLASSPWSITTIPSGFVFTRPNITTTYQAVNSGTFAYGFVAKSAICTKPGSSEVYPAGTYHHSYLYNDPAHPYDQIKQYAIKINRSGRTTAQNTVLNNFVNFLTGVGTTAGTARILYYCYQLP